MREKREMKKKSSLSRLAGLMRPYLLPLCLCVFAVILANGAELIKPVLSAVIIDDFLMAGKEQHGLYSIWGIGISYFAAVLLGALCTLFQVRTVTRLSQRILHSMRGRVFGKIMHMSMAGLDKHGTGRLITRATNDVETVNEFYSDVFINLFKDVFLLAGILIVMLALDWQLALVAFIGVPMIFAITFSIKRIIKRNFKFIKAVIGRINGFIAENVSGMRIVQAFNRQKDKYGEFKKLNRDYFKGTMTQVILNTFLRPSMEVINNLVIALLIAYGYHRVGGGTLEVGILYAFTNYVKQFFEPINDLAEKYTTVQSAFVSVDRIYEVLDEEGGEESLPASHKGKVQGEIEFQNVWFAYEGENWILKNVSFRLEKGQKAAFVGATGAGKTTIISLISRYYPIQKGRILIDGIPVEEWDLTDLRRGISTVLQDVFLFTGTIRDNIDMYGQMENGIISQALITAKADSFLKESGGMDALVEEQGLNFSTGERQLLSFARAIAGAPSVLVLDEATAHIDSNTEELVQKSIDAISKGRTSIFIAHRLSTIQSCDIIFVLVHGEIKEQGNHNELYELNGIYRHLVDAGLEEE